MGRCLCEFQSFFHGPQQQYDFRQCFQENQLFFFTYNDFIELFQYPNPLPYGLKEDPDFGGLINFVPNLPGKREYFKPRCNDAPVADLAFDIGDKLFCFKILDLPWFWRSMPCRGARVRHIPVQGPDQQVVCNRVMGMFEMGAVQLEVAMAHSVPDDRGLAKQGFFRKGFVHQKKGLFRKSRIGGQDL